jgi:hypothetical protein
VGHLQEIRKSALGFSKVPDPERGKDNGDRGAQGESRQIEFTLATQQGPAKAVDYAYGRVQAVQYSPFFRNNGTGKTDW